MHMPFIILLPSTHVLQIEFSYTKQLGSTPPGINTQFPSETA
jgi:hypothetical protein